MTMTMTMTMTSSPRSPHTRLLQLRVAGVAIAVLAMLVYVNVAQVNDDNSTAVRGAGVLVPDLDRALVERRREAESNAWYEYCLLVTAGFGALGALAGPPLIRRVNRA
jgi:hypothetical protein